MINNFTLPESLLRGRIRSMMIYAKNDRLRLKFSSQTLQERKVPFHSTGSLSLSSTETFWFSSVILHPHCETHSDWAATRKMLLGFTYLRPDETPPRWEEEKSVVIDRVSLTSQNSIIWGSPAWIHSVIHEYDKQRRKRGMTLIGLVTGWLMKQATAGGSPNVGMSQDRDLRERHPA